MSRTLSGNNERSQGAAPATGIVSGSPSFNNDEEKEAMSLLVAGGNKDAPLTLSKTRAGGPFRGWRMLLISGVLVLPLLITYSTGSFHVSTESKAVDIEPHGTGKTHSEDPATISVEEVHNNQGDLSMQELAKRTPLPLPLQPPFHIVQVGHARSGSTFQFYLLDAIARLKSGDQYEVNMAFRGRNITSKWYRKIAGESFVIKTHRSKDSALGTMQAKGEFVVFSSGMIEGKDEDILAFALINQEREKLEKCSLCEVDNYRHIFGLQADEIATIKTYMHTFEQIRQCCGLQMSKYEVARLNGCNMTELVKSPHYPHCERIDKQQIEEDMKNSPIPYRASSPKKNWVKPGDCAKYDDIIKQGRAFNGRKFNPKKDCLL